MSPTDLSETSLELQIMADMVGVASAAIKSLGSKIAEAPATYGEGWIIGQSADFDRSLAIDTRQLLAFLEETQPQVVADLGIGGEGNAQQNFLQRLVDTILVKGVLTVLRGGLKFNQHTVQLYYPLPTPGNETAARRFRQNRFSVTRQLQYSNEETKRALDLALFINGLPIITFELKNTITSQTVSDAIEQYKTTRKPAERLFRYGVCLAHFALDDQEAHFTTRLAGKETRFLPFNKGHNDGAGNPPNPHGLRTAWLWQDILQRESLANIIESFVQMVEVKEPETKKKSRTLVFPRYHQLDVVRRLVAAAEETGPGQRYLIQHSAGSGKSNSIAWLAQHLVELHDAKGGALFDSVIVVTDRRNLDDQIHRTMKGMANQAWIIGHADRSGQLRDLITMGKRIIITTVQKFPVIVKDIGDAHRDRDFAIIIDEAHSSQGGRAAGQMNAVLGGKALPSGEDDDTAEDAINQLVESRKMPSNASYFAFTATPKQRTLELFGQKTPDGTFEPFHSYTMKQAIQEGFILDVLQNYTPITSYYHLVKTIDDDPEFDTRKAGKALRNHVESHAATIARKAKIIVDHFQSQVITAGKINGEARALVATQSIRRAIDYWQAINRELAERGDPWKTIVAFTGEHDVAEVGKAQTESMLNGFPSKDIPDKLREKPYRMLIVADKYLTGFDEPLLHTMYVDKTLSGVKAVQTLSRLNRAAPGKKDTFVLDFANEPEQIVASFQPYYRTTLLSSETDPNKLHDMQAILDGAGVYRDELVVEFVDRYLANVERHELDAMLDVSVEEYKALDEEEQVEFKGTAKAFVRTYNFLSQLLPWNNIEWERLAVFLTYLTPRLPSPKEPELDRSILDAIDLDSYRAETKATINLGLEDEAGELDNPTQGGGGGLFEPEFDRLSAIVQSFNDFFAGAGFTDADRVARHATGLMLDDLVGNEHLKKIATNADQQNQRIEFDIALKSAVNDSWKDNWELFNKIDKDPEFKSAFSEHMFRLWAAKMATPSG